MRRRFWFGVVMAFCCVLTLGLQSPMQAQAAEENVTAAAPEEGQKGETLMPAQNVGPAPAPAEGQKAETPTTPARPPKWWEKAETPTTPAPPPKEKPQPLEKIVVTATRTERNPDDVPASITIITEEDIKKQNIQTVDEALAQVPGTYDRRAIGWMDPLASVNLRGFPADNQKRTLILLDGQDISTGFVNNVVWNNIPVQNIERIEVIRGPFSALYGGNAMGGVINIITKTPQKLEMLSQTSYGTYNSWNTYNGAGTRLWDKVSIQGGFNYRNTGGYPTAFAEAEPYPGTFIPFGEPSVLGARPTVANDKAYWPGYPLGNGTAYILGDCGNNFWNDYSINGKITLDLAEGHKWTFSTLAGYTSYGYGNYHSYLVNPATGTNAVNNAVNGLFAVGSTNQSIYLLEENFLQTYGRTRTQVYSLTTDDRLTDTTKLKFHFGLVNQPENWYAEPNYAAFAPPPTYLGGAGYVVLNPSQEWVGEVQLEQAIGQKQQLTGGFSYNTGWASTITYNLPNWRAESDYGTLASKAAGNTRNIGVFLQDEIAWHPKFSTVAGVRLDSWQTYAGETLLAAGLPETYLPTRSYTEVSPKIAFLYKPLDWMTWRTSVGTAFRPPNVYELYTTWSFFNLVFESNPHLKPETALSWEIGPTLKPFKGTEFTTTYFENYVTDMILVTGTSNPNISIEENAAKATIRGFEIELKQKLWSWLDVLGNTTLVDGRIRSDPDNLAAVGKKITYSPRQQFNFGVTATYWKLQANLSGRYVSKIMTSDTNSDVVNNVYGSYDPFFTLNSKITFSPVKYMDLSLAWDNMLNRQYFSYYLNPGRTWWLQLTLKY